MAGGRRMGRRGGIKHFPSAPSSYGPADGPGVLSFFASSDHNTTVTHYWVRIYDMGGSTILSERSIGKPLPNPANNLIRFDIRDLFVGLPNGNYTAKVYAVSSGGMSTSSDDDFVIPIS